jgi:hypothetical protein
MSKALELSGFRAVRIDVALWLGRATVQMRLSAVGSALEIRGRHQRQGLGDRDEQGLGDPLTGASMAVNIFPCSFHSVLIVGWQK